MALFPLTVLMVYQDKLPKKDVVKIVFALKPHSSSVLPEMIAGFFGLPQIWLI